MYCVNCGVKLADSEKCCPLCQTPVYHPNIKREETPPPYPKIASSPENVNPMGLLFVITFLFLQPILITLFCDLQLNMRVTWSAYAVGGVLLAYIVIVLPCWFKKPNPVIFTPIDLTASALLLLYINYSLGKHWFLTFAFPIICYSGILLCTVITLCKYVKRGYLYIFGGGLTALALFFIFIEIFYCITFKDQVRIVWSPYPAVVCAVFGIMLIIIAICKPFRESLKKIFFV